MSLGDLQQLTMLAVARLGDQGFGKAIRDELIAVAGRDLSVSAIYVTLVRLEDQGLVTSNKTDPDPKRGGRGKRFFRLTPQGWEALQRTRESVARMWDGVEPA